MRFRLKEVLKEKEITPYRLEVDMDMNHKTINDIVNNRTRGISFRILEDLCDYLDCTPNDLIERRRR